MSERPPVFAHTPAWSHMNAAAARGVLELPRCRDCGTWQYPPRELCVQCLGPGIEWEPVDGGGTVLSWTEVHASLEPFFRQHAPWRMGKVRLEAGPWLFCHLARAACRGGAKVRVYLRADANGAGALIALPAGSEDFSEFDALLKGKTE